MRLLHPSKLNIITVCGFDYLCEHLADKCSSKTGSKLLFGFAGPPTVQHNRWVKCVMKTMAGGFPGYKSRWKDEEEGGRGVGGAAFSWQGERRATEQTAFMIPTDSEGLNFHWGCLTSAVTKQEVAWGSLRGCKLLCSEIKSVIFTIN